MKGRTGGVVDVPKSLWGRDRVAASMPPYTPAPKTPRGRGAWSPVSRDPRFSRRTPEAILSEINKHQAGAAIGGGPSWVARILANKARKSHICSRSRKDLLVKMQQIAAASSDQGLKTPQLEQAKEQQPAHKAHMETAVLLPPAHPRCGGECSRPVACAPFDAA